MGYMHKSGHHQKFVYILLSAESALGLPCLSRLRTMKIRWCDSTYRQQHTAEEHSCIPGVGQPYYGLARHCRRHPPTLSLHSLLVYYGIIHLG